MRILLACLALAATSPAWAEVDFRKDKHAREDLAVLSACFDAAGTWEAAQECVNLTYEGCIGRFGKSASHADEGNCMSRELGLWEHLLDTETRKLEAWTVLKDNKIAEVGLRQPYAHQSFLGSLEKWTAYREAQCAFVVEQWTSGTIGITAVPHCQMDLVVERLFRLRPVLSEISDKAQP